MNRNLLKGHSVLMNRRSIAISQNQEINPIIQTTKSSIKIYKMPGKYKN